MRQPNACDIVRTLSHRGEGATEMIRGARQKRIFAKGETGMSRVSLHSQRNNGRQQHQEKKGGCTISLVYKTIPIEPKQCVRSLEQGKPSQPPPRSPKDAASTSSSFRSRPRPPTNRQRSGSGGLHQRKFDIRGETTRRSAAALSRPFRS